MTPERSIESVDPDLIEQLRNLLGEMNYSQEGIHSITGHRDLRHVNKDQLYDLRSRLEAGGKLGQLTKFFCLGVPMDRARFAKTIEPMTPTQWREMGLVKIQGDRVEANILLMPDGQTVLAADRPPQPGRPPKADYVMDSGGGTKILTTLAIRNPVERSADLGCGCGMLAMRAAAFSREVVAVDLNPRALAYARFNAALNDLKNIRCVHADVFADPRSFAGKGFDCIFFQPPFVISPSTQLIYCDSPLEGDQISRHAVEVASRLLRENGFAQLIINWAHFNGDDWKARLRSWFVHSGCDTWIMRSETRNPESYAQMWLADNQMLNKANLQEWLNYYRRLGIEAISLGVIILRKRTVKQNWFVLDNSPEKMHGQAGRHVIRIFQAQDFLETITDDDLLDTRLKPPGDLRLNQQLIPNANGWRIGHCRSYLESGLVFQLDHDARVAFLVTHSDGQTKLRDIINAMASHFNIIEDSIVPPALNAARMLIYYGLMLPV